MKKVTLTEDQENALEVFSDFLADSSEKYMIIQGAAGCGKSTLIPYLYDHLKVQYKMYQLLLQTQPDKGEFSIVLSATTNKAAAVLKEITGEKTTTIHSLLNLKVTYNKQTGKPKLIKTHSYQLIYNKLIIVDEASMIDDKLFKILDETTMNSKVVFIGDQYQLAPVGQQKSIMENLPCTKVTMNKIMRNSGTIMKTGAQYRDTVESSIFKNMPNTQTVKQVTGPEFRSLIDDAFTDPDYSVNSAKVLTWKNKRVHAYNTYIRKIKNLPPTVTEGEVLFTNNPILSGSHKWSVDSPVLITGIKGNAVSHGVEGKMLEIDGKVSCFLPNDYLEAKAFMKSTAKQKDWALFYAVKETWLDLRPAYASTVHKSQGSSYDTVFIDLKGIGKCHIWSDVARMLYVSISRAVKQVYLYGSLPPKYCERAIP